MSMSDGRTRLRKIAFQVGGKFFRFALNPEDMRHSKPHRATTVKTKSRIVVEDFQSDVPTISIKGSTGFNPTGKTADRGIEKIKEMKAYLEYIAEMGGNGRTGAEEIYFHNFTNSESFAVHLAPEGVTFSQSVNSPLVHNYEINFVVLRKAGEPKDGDVISPQIGNQHPSIGEIPSFDSIFPTVDSHWAQANYNSQATGEQGTDVYKDIYGVGDNTEVNTPNDGPLFQNTPVNPQAPSPMSYNYGQTELGYIIGYYGRGG